MAGFNFYIPTRVLFGPGMLNELATVKLPGRKALIITTAGKSVKKYGYLDRVIALLKQNNDTQCVVFDKVMPNPLLSHVREAAALCRAEGCDFVIGLGGGSPIDSAKAIALAAANEGDYWDYVEGGKKPAGALPLLLQRVPVPKPIPGRLSPTMRAAIKWVLVVMNCSRYCRLWIRS